MIVLREQMHRSTEHLGQKYKERGETYDERTGSDVEKRKGIYHETHIKKNRR